MNRIVYITISLLCFFDHELRAQPDYLVVPLSLNNNFSDEIYAVPYNHGIVFCSNRRTHLLVNRVDSANRPLFHLFYAPMKDSTRWGASKILSRKIPINAHQGPFSISADGQEIYFSLNDDTGQQIFSATQSKGEWTNIRPFIYNRPYITITHPSLSHDGKRLFFASNMPGGFGGFDIYVCEMTPNGWGLPKNLGPNVNTAENELYPFIHANGELYFSSSAHGSMGGLDIFSTSEVDGVWETPLRLEEDINSTADDISFVATNANATTGYFASNRSGKSFDIYSFKSLFPTFTDCQEQDEINYTRGFSEKETIGRDTATLKLMWEFSDGAVMYGEEVWHTFPSTGQYEVILNVIDSLTGVVTKQVANLIFDVLDWEQPYITAEETVKAGASVAFDALKTYLPDMEIEEYYWMFGDGTRKKGIRTEHSYATPGVYQVKLGVIGKSKYTGKKEKVCVFREITVQ